MDLATVGAWLKNQVPPDARKIVVGYALQLAITAETRDQAKAKGVDEATLKIIDGAGPLLAQQLQKLLGL